MTEKEIYFENLKLEIGTANPDTTTKDIWKVPVVGRLVTIDADDMVQTHLLLADEVDFDENYVELYDGETVRGTLPALPGEYVVKCAIPEVGTLLSEIIDGACYGIDTCTLCHVIPGISECDWVPMYKELWMRAVLEG